MLLIFYSREEFFIINFFIKVLRFLPHRVALSFGRFLGRLARLILWKKVDRCESRCVMALGVGITEAREIIKKSFINMGMSIIEFIRFPVMKPRVEDFTIFDDDSKKLLTEAISRGRGVILMVAHIDNWELAAMRAISDGFPLYVVYTPQRNQGGVNDIIAKIRTETAGMVLIGNKGPGLREIFRALKSGGTVVIMQDLDARDGITMKFLGLPAKTHDGIVKLYQKFKCPVIPVKLLRDDKNPSLHHIILREILSDRPGFGEDLMSSLELCNKAIEDLIKKNPEQWFWIMDRWEFAFRELEQGVKN